MNVLFAVPVVGFVVILAIMLNDQFRSRNPVPMQQQIAHARAIAAYERGLGMDFDILRQQARKATIAMYHMKESAKQAADRMEKANAAD